MFTSKEKKEKVLVYAFKDIKVHNYNTEEERWSYWAKSI